VHQEETKNFSSGTGCLGAESKGSRERARDHSLKGINGERRRTGQEEGKSRDSW